MTNHSPPFSSPEWLHAHLTQGLHAAAQPLTILLASLGAGHTDGMNADQLRELTASSVVEVQRVCTLFTSLQQLVMAQSLPPELSLMPLLPVVSEIVDESNRRWATDASVQFGFRVFSQPPAQCASVLIDRGRMRQALTATLAIARALSRGGATLELHASPVPDELQLILQNASGPDVPVNGEMSLGLALAEAHIRSQGGGFTYTLRPFRVVISLPLAAM